jgi:glycine cleavage system transcriptional repressor
VHGADHPGIVAAVTRVLADAGVNVTDLQTRLARELYVMVIDAAVPAGLALEELDRRLRAVADEQGVTITVRPADADVL